eukprot:scaffold4308_cov118-Isochrysis_galbana.AAC.1
MTWSSSSALGRFARGGAGITTSPLGCTRGTNARTAPRSTLDGRPLRRGSQRGWTGERLRPAAQSLQPSLLSQHWGRGRSRHAGGPLQPHQAHRTYRTDHS